MMGSMLTTCAWKHLVEGLKRTDLLKGIISDRDTVQEITFTTPEGETIFVPQGSNLELRIGAPGDLYAIGIEDGVGSYGMTHGPVVELGDMLVVPPPNSTAKIICFHPDGRETHTHKVDASGTEWEAIQFVGPSLAHAYAAKISL